MDAFLYVLIWGALLYAWAYGVRWILRKDIAEWKIEKAERKAKRDALRHAAQEAEDIDAEFERYLKGEK